MNIVKRSLSLVLALCLLLGAGPVQASAAGFTSIDLSDLGLSTTALTMGSKPGDGTSAGEPFPENTGGSYSFRIPSLVTLSDGTVVAAADARWNTTYDGGGLDTVVARSTDQGASWNYTFANYLGDNGNTYNGSSSCFIDPALAVTDDDTLYLLVDLYPYGVALNGQKETAPAATVGFFDNNKLKLSSNNHTSYDYYLNLTDYKIYSYNGDTEVSGYTVDKHFNITGTNVSTNLFFSDSPYKVVRTGYLYLTTSTDKGASWSEPKLLNLKTDSELVCLVGPGRGIVTGGRIVFPVYSYASSGDEFTGLVYSEDNGATWKRTASLSGIDSSEAAVVALANGSLRVFFRNHTGCLCYADYSFSNGWGSHVQTTVKTNSNTQLSAITYGKTMDGKQVILVSCPTGPNAQGSASSDGSYRTSGKIFAGLVDGTDYTMTWTDGLAVTNVASGQLSGSSYTDAQGFFAYSCLTELSDGSVAILYENNQFGWGAGNSYGYTLEFKTYTRAQLEGAFGQTFDVPTVTLTDAATGVTVSGLPVPESGEWILTVVPDQTVAGLTDEYAAFDVTVTHSVTGETYPGSAKVTLPVTALFTATGLYAFIVENGAVQTVTPAILSDGAITFTAPHFSVMGAAVDADTPEVEITNTVDVVLQVGETSQTYTDDTGDHSETTTNVQPNSTIATMTVTGKPAVAGATVLSSNTGVSLADCLYTFTASGNYYIVESASIPGVYLNHFSTTTSTAPNCTTQGLIKVSQGYFTNMFQLQAQNIDNSSALARTLHFHMEASTPYWNRCGNDSSEKCHEYLYRPAEAGEESSAEIPGFVQITSTSQIENGGQYLIAAKNNAGNYYVLHPSTYSVSTSHVAKVNATGGNATTEVTFKGVAPGTTKAIVGTTQYNITVYETVEITVNYQLDGTTVTTGKLQVASNAASATLPATVAGADGTIYAVGNTALTLTGASEYNVEVTKSDAVGGGFVGSTNIQSTTVANRKVTEMTLTTGISYDLNPADTLTDGQTIQWVSGDDAVATVDQNGLVTAAGVGSTTVTAYIYNADGSLSSVSAVPVTVLPPADEDAAATRTVALYVDTVANTTVYCVINGDTDNAFEVIEGELIYGKFEKATGNSTDSDTTTALSFFGAPDEGYALTYMNATDSEGHYSSLHDENDALVNGDGYYYNTGAKSGAGYWQAVGLGGNSTTAPNWDLIKTMVEWAIAKGCDGGQGFTRRQSEGDLCSNLTFSSARLPTVSKTLNGVLPVSCKTVDFRRYDGVNMLEAYVGEYVYFTITVTVEAPTIFVDDEGNVWTDTSTGSKYSPISYGDADDASTVGATLTDKLPGAYFYSKELDENDGDTNGDGFPLDGILPNEADQKAAQTILKDDMNKAWTEEEIAAGKRTLEYFVVFAITDEYLDKDILNEVDLDYHYEAKFSKGAGDVIGSDAANIHVIGGTMPNYVIDFGQQVTITDTSDNGAFGFRSADIAKSTASCRYGEITAIQKNAAGKWELTYKPTAILQGAETVILRSKDNDIINSFLIYPATSVYYEEGFLFEGAVEGWDTDSAKKATMTQTAELLGTKQYPYGYDPIYAGAAGSYYGSPSYAETSASGVQTSFTFTGTGFEIYANCEDESGYVSVLNQGGQVMKLYMINTEVEPGDTPATDQQTGTFYSLPVVSEKTLPHGTYTVVIRKTNDGKPIQIDGVRIINTVNDSAVFLSDKEDNPQFYQLRDMLLNAMGVSDTTSEDYGTLAEMAEQVYNQNADATGLITAESINYSESEDILQDLLDNGPKNEIYLFAGHTFTFKVSTSRVMQLGLKAPKASTTYTLKFAPEGGEETVVTENGGIHTSVDMFYALGNPTGTETTYTVTVSNTGSSVLAITDLKICDDPNAAFVPLSVGDIEKVLEEAGYPTVEEPEDTEPTEPGDSDKPGNDIGFNNRLAGGNRFETAFLVADRMKQTLGIEKFDAVVVASGTNFADALSGSYLAAVKNAPILLSFSADSINNRVKDYIRDNLNPGGTVYILGGESAVPASMETGLEEFTVNRLKGKDRFGTNLAILEEAGVGSKPILVCTGLGFADSLSASAAGLPILLVWKDLTQGQQDFLNSVAGNNLYVIGGTGAVSEHMEEQLSQYGTVRRLAGGSRFDTSVMIAEEFFDGPEAAVLAYAWDFPDGLCGGPLAAAMKAPLILTMYNYEDRAAEYVQDKKIQNGITLGGEKLIPGSSILRIFVESGENQLPFG